MTEYDWKLLNMTEYDWILPTMIEYDWIWLNMREYDCEWIWLNMTEYDQIWLNMTKNDLLWLWMNMTFFLITQSNCLYWRQIKYAINIQIVYRIWLSFHFHTAYSQPWHPGCPLILFPIEDVLLVAENTVSLALKYNH